MVVTSPNYTERWYFRSRLHRVGTATKVMANEWWMNVRSTVMTGLLRDGVQGAMEAAQPTEPYFWTSQRCRGDWATQF